jgi:glycosyltransferase involved in cell wall biosynthesis
VREFDAGLVAHPDDPASLAAQCVTLLHGGDTLAAAVRGTNAAREALSWEQAAEAHERLYEQVLAGRPS